MLALKTFADLITLEMANLAATYAQLLVADKSRHYSSISQDQRIALARRNLSAVVEACSSQNSAPLLNLFASEKNINNKPQQPESVHLEQAFYEAECLGQILTPVVTSLEAGRFLWSLLAEVRSFLLGSSEGSAFFQQNALVEQGREANPAASKQVEMKNSQALLRTIIDATPDWIFVKDREHRYQLVNKGYSDSMGIAAGEFIGKNDLELGFPEEIVKGNPDEGIVGFWNYDNQVFDTGETIFIDVEPAEINGQRVFQNTIKAPIHDVDGNIQGVLGYVRDVTEREQLLAWSQQLYDASIELNKAETYIDVIHVIRKYTIARSAEYVSLGHFGRPVPIDEAAPDKVKMLARWSEVSESLVQSEYNLREMPGVRKFVQPQPVVIDDFSKEEIDSNTRALYDSLDAKSLVYVPIAVAGMWNGFIAIIYQHQRSFSQLEMEQALTLASQVSVAVQNLYNVEEARQNALDAERGREALARYSKRLQQLQEITRQMARELRPGRVAYQNSLDAVAALVDARYAAMVLLTERDEHVHFYYGISGEQIEAVGDNLNDENLLNVVLGGIQSRISKDKPNKGHSGDVLEEHHPGMADYLTVPILFGDQTLGRIQFAEHAEGNFGPDDEALVASFATALADTLRSARLFETIQRRAKELEVVSELGMEISTVLNPDVLLANIVERTKEDFELCLVQIYLLNEGNGSLDLAVAAGDYEEMVREGISISIDEEHSPIAQAARLQEGVIIENLQQRPEIVGWSQFQYAEAEIATPLIVGSGLLGVLDVQTDEPNRFTNEDLQIQKILAGQIAIALDNVRLFEQLERRVQREQDIREVTEKLRAAPNLEKLVKVATEELAQRLAASHARMELGIETPIEETNLGDWEQRNGNIKDRNI